MHGDKFSILNFELHTSVCYPLREGEDIDMRANRAMFTSKQFTFIYYDVYMSLWAYVQNWIYHVTLEELSSRLRRNSVATLQNYNEVLKT